MWTKMLIVVLLFFIVANPALFKMMRQVLGSWVASAEGLPSTAGLLLHAVVFAVLARFIMRALARRQARKYYSQYADEYADEYAEDYEDFTEERVPSGYAEEYMIPGVYMTEKYTGFKGNLAPRGLPVKRTKKGVKKGAKKGTSKYLELTPQELYTELRPAMITDPTEGISRGMYPVNMAMILLIIVFILFVAATLRSRA